MLDTEFNELFKTTSDSEHELLVKLLECCFVDGNILGFKATSVKLTDEDAEKIKKLKNIK